MLLISTYVLFICVRSIVLVGSGTGPRPDLRRECAAAKAAAVEGERERRVYKQGARLIIAVPKNRSAFKQKQLGIPGWDKTLVLLFSNHNGPRN